MVPRMACKPSVLVVLGMEGSITNFPKSSLSASRFQICSRSGGEEHFNREKSS